MSAPKFNSYNNHIRLAQKKKTINSDGGHAEQLGDPAKDGKK